MRVGFIGLGSQGGPMARRIVEGGFEMTLWARRPASLEPYADTAAKVAGSPAELAAASDLVCLCVVGDDDVREVLDGETGVLAGLASGGIVAIHSTVHPDTCREIAETAAAQGVSVIDAPVSGGAPAVEEGTLLVMVGGDEEVVERCRPVFATYADPIVHLGPLGSGQVTKILNNLLFTANLGSAISTLELGESLGIPRERLAEVLNRGSATSKALGSIAMFGGTLEGLAPIAGALLQKDVRHAASIAATASAPQGAVFTAADAALERWNTRGDTRRLRRGGPHGRPDGARARRLPATRSARWAGPPKSAPAVAELGAQAGRGLAAVAGDAESVMVCVFTDEQVRAGVPDRRCCSAMSPGAALVVHTTGSPRTAQAIAAHSPGVDVVDAPVSGGPHDIAAGAVTLFVGGADDAVARGPAGARRYGDPILHVGRRRGPTGEADQQHDVRRPDRAGRRGGAAGRPARRSTRRRCWTR